MKKGWIAALVAVGMVGTAAAEVGEVKSSPLDPQIKTVPLNPEFVKWLKQKNNKALKSQSNIIQTSVGKRATGWIPNPIPKEVHHSQKKEGTLEDGTFPRRFDLSDPNLDGYRGDSLLTPVKDQGKCGVCWAFAGFGSYEGQVKVDGLGTYDFSEQNLRYLNGTILSQNDPCSGGNFSMITAYLMRGSGPVSEQDDPYDLNSGPNVNAKPIRYADDITEFPVRDFNHKFDIGYIKNALYSMHRPLYVSMQVGWGTAGETGKSVWDATTNSFYCNGEGQICQSNHAVVIVGWDDDYQAQGQTGAFIVRNSWGSSFGDQGYFYVPYNDDSIALSGTIGLFNDINYLNEKVKIYQWDVLPIANGVGLRDNHPVWGANVFSVKDDGVVEKIVIYNYFSNSDIEIKLFKTLKTGNNGVSFENQVGDTVSIQSMIRGWHSIKIPKPVAIKKGETLIVQVKILNRNFSLLAAESDIQGFTDATAGAGQSYVSTDGQTFNDLQDVMPGSDMNLAIKALVNTQQGPTPPPSGKCARNDFNGDGRSDILWRDGQNGKVFVWLMQASGWYSVKARGHISPTYVSEAVGDFNGDGRADVLWRDKYTGQVYIWLMHSDVWYDVKPRGHISTRYHMEAVGDFNGDGRDDIVWRDGDTGKVFVWLMKSDVWYNNLSRGKISVDYDSMVK